MKQYKYIPFQDLRWQYQRRRRLQKAVEDFIMTVILSAAYGITMGLMLTGMWIIF